MKPLKYTLALIIVTLLVYCFAAHRSEADDMNDAGEAVNGLAVELFLKLPPRQNLVFSPFSISSAFAMTYAGAKSDTAAEMETALCFNAAIHESFKNLTTQMQNIPEEAAELLIANSIWPDDKYRLSNSYTSLVKKYYGCDIFPQNYAKNPTESVNNINGWVAANTKNKIEKILQDEAVNADTRLVLVNALYFKSQWMEAFSESHTAPAMFYPHESEPTEVETMNIVRTFDYMEDSHAQVISLPYRYNAYSMKIILPKDRDVTFFESMLDQKRLEKYLANSSSARVNLKLPKFKIESSFDLNEAMQALGVKAAFMSDAADFSGINGKKDLYIGSAVHKAIVEVDENGTEAAAATAIVMTRVSAPLLEETPIDFIADHPFLFVIVENETDTVLFMGRVAKP